MEPDEDVAELLRSAVSPVPAETVERSVAAVLGRLRADQAVKAARAAKAANAAEASKADKTCEACEAERTAPVEHSAERPADRQGDRQADSPG